MEAAAGFLLVAFGIGYLVWGLRRAAGRRLHGHAHAHYDHVHDPGKTTAWSLFLLFSADPCVAVIPLMFAAAPLGVVRTRGRRSDLRGGDDRDDGAAGPVRPSGCPGAARGLARPVWRRRCGRCHRRRGRGRRRVGMVEYARSTKRGDHAVEEPRRQAGSLTWKYTLGGAVLGLGALAGALLLRVLGGAQVSTDLRENSFFYLYDLVGTCLVFSEVGFSTAAAPTAPVRAGPVSRVVGAGPPDGSRERPNVSQPLPAGGRARGPVWRTPVA